MEIFDLGAPVAVKSDFQTSASGPADICVSGRTGRLHRLDVAVGDAARHIGQPAIKRVTEPSARRTNAALLSLAQPAAVGETDATQASGAALDAHPVGVSFDAQYGGADLPIVAELSADQSARAVEISRIRANHRIAPARLAPGIAAIDAKIKASPIERQC